MLKKIDWYIIKKFLGTYFFTIVLILAIAIVLDYNDKMDRFEQHETPVWEIIKYYLNYIPYFANLFGPLFVFVACIFFTSKIAGDSEVIAMLASGISFNRLLRPYMLSAAFLGGLTFFLNSFVIPSTSKDRIEFLNTYYKDRQVKTSLNNQMMVEPGVVMYIYRFETNNNTGAKFALERYDGKKLASRLTADKAQYKGDYRWELTRWNIRDINADGETLRSGEKMDTLVAIGPEDIIFQKNDFEKMTTPELGAYIDKQRARGTGNIQEFEIEYHKRFAAIATSFILTLIGVCLSSKKVRGGMGINLGIGLVLAFLYILFQTVSSTFAVSGDTPVIIAVWMPNIVFLGIAWYLYLYKAPR
ncbi:MAG: LptF/LptG family permease [Bacteroidales bacterium]|nr:LptF/LptG family permease [Candidatus Liminaster caballi]